MRLGGNMVLAVVMLAGLCGAASLHAMAHASGVDDTVSDAEMLSSAIAACKSDNFDGFFELFTQNDAVRKAHLAPQIEVRALQQPGKLMRSIIGRDYRDYRIAMQDYQYVDAAAPAGQDSRQQMQIKPRLLSGKTWQVDYIKVEYDGKGEGDDPGALVRTIGKPGAYIFEFSNGCWQLTRDLR
ncbi:hypothetical protein [Sphingomonas alpina]|uniref:DUF4019 domain-containing protein n=2 Tax=Sphingomonas alpina TaxID=653931 RepID=A0A7H0LDZ0_9SPHN|nr:hypothetical protein [Sphingomonas alpina]QNQ07893.1 hypothetical protein H3Z74_13930 [Sphingomonas alpina]